MVLVLAEFAYGFDWALAGLFKMVMIVLLETIEQSQLEKEVRSVKRYVWLEQGSELHICPFSCSDAEAAAFPFASVDAHGQMASWRCVMGMVIGDT